MDKLKIDIDDRTLNFLLFLISIKKFDALSLWRVLHKPDQNNEMWKQYLKHEEQKCGQ